MIRKMTNKNEESDLRCSVCDHNCTLVDNIAKCWCKQGYTLVNSTTCVDYNECEQQKICLHGLCINTQGSYECHCPDGYYSVNNNCLDIDECQTDTTCNGTCINTIGSYTCSCPEGFVTDGSLCVENGNNTKGCDELSTIENAKIECTDGDDGIYPVGSECIVNCRTGFKLKGKQNIVCEDNGKWSENDTHCIAIPRPFIRCPSNSRYLLPKGDKHMMVHISQPKTNMDWTRYVTSVPAWGKQLQALLTVGVTSITFKVSSPVSDHVASCRTLITVTDVEKPVVRDCPNDLYLQLAPGTSVQQISWKEPTFSDNVEVAHVYKSMSPGQILGVGNHRVTYVAADSSGNIATCQFAIDITESWFRPPKLDVEVLSLSRALIDCPEKVLHDDSKPGEKVNSGCDEKQTKASNQPSSGKKMPLYSRPSVSPQMNQ